MRDNRRKERRGQQKHDHWKARQDPSGPLGLSVSTSLLLRPPDCFLCTCTHLSGMSNMFWKGEGCAQFPLKSETHSRQAALPSYRRCKQPMENRSPFLWTLSKELFLSPYASLCMFTPCSPCQAAIFDNRTSMAAWEASNTFPG